MTKTYSIFDPTMAPIDLDCINAVKDLLTQSFIGLHTVTIQQAHIYETVTGPAALYPFARIEGEHGNADGAFHCSFGAENTDVTDVALAFTGLGLSGYQRGRFLGLSDDPADWRATSLSGRP